jgi:hypothetical protein
VRLWAAIQTDRFGRHLYLFRAGGLPSREAVCRCLRLSGAEALTLVPIDPETLPVVSEEAAAMTRSQEGPPRVDKDQPWSGS